MKLLVKRLDPSARLPAYAHPGDAGMDVYANEHAVLAPGERRLVSTGLVLAVPKGYECQVRPKSGLALRHGVTLLNTPGTVDAGYRGELKVLLVNLGDKPFAVERGKKIAQLVFARVERAALEEGEPEATARGEGGFGSTGLD